MGHGLQNIGYSNSCNESTLDAIAAEVMRAREKFPGTRFLLAAIVEEVGELAEAIFEQSAVDTRKEAIQVCAVAVRIIEEGDSSTYSAGGFVALTAGVGEVARRFLQRGLVKPALRSLAQNALKIRDDGDSTFDDLTADESKA